MLCVVRFLGLVEIFLKGEGMVFGVGFFVVDWKSFFLLVPNFCVSVYKIIIRIL